MAIRQKQPYSRSRHKPQSRSEVPATRYYHYKHLGCNPSSLLGASLDARCIAGSVLCLSFLSPRRCSLDEGFIAGYAFLLISFGWVPGCLLHSWFHPSFLFSSSPPPNCTLLGASSQLEVQPRCQTNRPFCSSNGASCATDVRCSRAWS